MSTTEPTPPPGDSGTLYGIAGTNEHLDIARRAILFDFAGVLTGLAEAIDGLAGGSDMPEPMLAADAVAQAQVARRYFDGLDCFGWSSAGTERR